MATSLDVPSSQTSADGQNSVHVFGDPKIEGRLIKIDEIALIETILKDVTSRLTSVQMMTKRGFGRFHENEIEKIILKVNGILLQLSTLNIMQVDVGASERRAREEMDEGFKEIERTYLNSMENLFRSEKLKFKGYEELENSCLQCIENMRSKSAGLQLQKLELPPVSGPSGDSAASVEQIASENKTENEEESSVPRKESNAVDDRPSVSLIVIGDPKNEKISLKIDFSEISLIETNLKDVSWRLTNVFQMMTMHAGFDTFLQNEMKNIHIKVEESIALVSTLNIMHEDMGDWERQVREKMNEILKEIQETYLIRLENLSQLLKSNLLDALDSFLERIENNGLNAPGLQLQGSELPPVPGPSGNNSAPSEDPVASEETEKLLVELQYPFLECTENIGLKSVGQLQLQGAEIPPVPGLSGYHSAPSEEQGVSEEIETLLEELQISLPECTKNIGLIAADLHFQRSELSPVPGLSGDSQSPATSEDQSVLEEMENFLEELQCSFLECTENIGLKAAGLQLQRSAPGSAEDHPYTSEKEIASEDESEIEDEICCLPSEKSIVDDDNSSNEEAIQ